MTDSRFLPMLAKELPRDPNTDKPKLPYGPQREDWRMEPKLDGWRFIAHKIPFGRCYWYCGRAGSTRESVSLDNVADTLNLPDDTILDGEIIVPEAGASSGDVSTALAKGLPVQYVVFDLIQLAGQDVRGLPFENRRYLLERIGFDGVSAKLVPSVEPSEALYDAWVTNGPLEGVMVKNRQGRYSSGKRSVQMLKGKPQQTLEGRIISFTEGKNGRAGSIGAIEVEIVDGNYVAKYGEGHTTSVACYPWLSDEIMGVPVKFCPSDQWRSWHPAYAYLGRMIEFKVSLILKGGGCRHPVFSSFRDDRDD